MELSGKIFIITLKSQLGEFENTPTKFVFSWSSLDVKLANTESKVLPVDITSTSYAAAGGEKGRYNFKNFLPLEKSVWILDAGIGENGGSGSLNAEINADFDSSCESKLKSLGKSGSGMSPKALCECSYFGLFEILPSTGKLRSVLE